MEPGASVPGKRLGAIESLATTGVPRGMLVAPVIAGLNDHEIPAILEAAASAGASFASLVVLRLPHGVGALFDDWLERHYPERRAKVMHRVQSMRGGRLYDARFKIRQRGTGIFADQVQALFDLARRKAKLRPDGPVLSTAHPPSVRSSASSTASGLAQQDRDLLSPTALAVSAAVPADGAGLVVIQHPVAVPRARSPRLRSIQTCCPGIEARAPTWSLVAA